MSDRVLWWDCAVGAAGDMLLASLLDAGADVDVVRAGLQGLGLSGWSVEPNEVRRGAFRALHAGVQVEGTTENDGDAHAHAHAHEGHEHHHHHGEGHPHRPWRVVRDLIEGAELPDRVRERSLRVYERLAQAEASLHGMELDDVELHEVGAVDAIVDVVGTCLALEALDIDRIVATALPLGTGHVHGAHGRIPLPAPATLTLVLGWPVHPSPWPGEWVTPTGAALVTTLASPGPPPAMAPEAVGHGAGTRDPRHVANVVRAVVGRSTSEAPALQPVVELAATIDDSLPEWEPPLLAGLLEAGALDVWSVAATMKHGRPGRVVHALVRPGDADRLSEQLLRQSTTLGVRRQPWQREVLERWFVPVQTPYGEVRMKVGGRDGEVWQAVPEHRDVARCAAAAQVSLPTVYSAALSAYGIASTDP